MAGKEAASLRNIPRVDALLAHKGAAPLVAEGGRELATQCIRDAIDAVRTQLKAGEAAAVDETSILAAARARLPTGR